MNKQPWQQLIASVGVEINPADWFSHTAEIAGDASICLVSVGGTQNNDFVLSGHLQATPLLKRYEAVQHILLTLGQPVSRVRLMRLPAGMKTRQGQWYYQYYRYHPVYIPIQTDKHLLYQGEQSLHLVQGEICTQTIHGMENRGEQDAVHLVIEYGKPLSWPADLYPVDLPVNIQWSEYVNNQAYFNVFTPDEFRQLSNDFIAYLQKSAITSENFVQVQQHIYDLQQRWQIAFNRFGHDSHGELAYWQIILDFKAHIFPLVRTRFKQLDTAGRCILEQIFSMLMTEPPPPRRINRHLLNNQSRKRNKQKQRIVTPRFIRPIFIVSAPRSGSTLLFNCLSQCIDLWSTGEENHELIEYIKGLHPADKGYVSNRLTAEDASAEIAQQLTQRFSQRLIDRCGRVYQELSANKQPSQIRFLEKTPKNALRIPFLKALFPDAGFIYLYREPRANINSMMEGWRSRRFIAYSDLPGWFFKDWSFLLIPGWSSLNHCSLAEITAYQWKIANQTIIQDLKLLSNTDWHMLSYEELITDPQTKLKQLIDFMQLDWNQHIQKLTEKALPVTTVTLSSPQSDKWKKHARELEKVFTQIAPVVTMIASIH
ncbi:MAG: sulfotransferase [Candidatus Brocadiaceae bacterium]|nr:sulfotransferase [Candidatus Brocadiaceae bacterium]